MCRMHRIGFVIGTKNYRLYDPCPKVDSIRRNQRIMNFSQTAYFQNVIFDNNYLLGGFPMKIETEISLLISYRFAIFLV